MKRIGIQSIVMKMVCVLLILSASSCLKKSHKRPPKIDPGFSNYIGAFTAGVISSESTIKIQLSQENPAARIDGNPVTEKYFKFSPEIEGKTYWIDKRTLEFRPDKRLQSDEIYDASFYLSKLISVPSKFNTLEFQFSIIKQAFAVSNDGLFVPDVNNGLRYQLKGKVRTADVAEPDKIEKIITAKQDGRLLPMIWTHDADKKTHLYEIDSIRREDMAGKVEIEWDGSEIGVSETGNSKVEIPATNEFRILSVKVTQEPEQFVTINFSDPLDNSQNIEGLIRISNDFNQRFTIDNSLIRVYTQSRLSGNLMLYVDASIKNKEGKILTKPFATELSFEDLKPAIRLLGNGVILPNSNGLILPFEAVNLTKVDIKIMKIFENNIAQFLQVNNLDGSNQLRRVGKVVYKETMPLKASGVIDYGKWNTFSVDLTKLIEKDPGAIYQVKFQFNKTYTRYDCAGATNQSQEMQTIDSEEDEDYQQGYDDEYYDYYDYYYPSNYDWNERENPCHDSYYTSDKFVQRNILASDLGIIAKAGAKNSMTFIVSDLRTTEPINDVVVELYSYQNQLIASTTTLNEGMAKIELKEKPYILVAKKGTQRGYLRLDDGNSLSMSKFDVGGEQVQKGLKGYLYGERGVWRPGDTLFLTFILEDKNQVLPKGHPVNLELTNPRGQLMNRIVNTSGINGFYRFSISTDASAPTGNWTATVKVGGAIFTKTIKIETIKPNRLKLNLVMADKTLRTDKPIVGNLNVSWLTGATARNLKANITVNLVASTTKFDRFKDFVFDDPTKRFHAEEQVIFEGKINDQGTARISKELAVGQACPGMLKANFLLKVFEESGDFSTDFQSLPLSPYKAFVGLKFPKGDKYSGMLETDQNHEIEIATVDPSGNPVSLKDLAVTVYKVNWRWWWNSSDDDLASYEGTNERELIYSTTCSTTKGKGRFNLKIAYPNWGRFLVKISDPDGGHSAGRAIYIDWPYWKSRDRAKDPEAATMLSFSSDKTDYKVGETATLTIPTGGKGRALVSIESGSRVIDAYWVKADKQEMICKFKITPEMAPNVYVHVTLVQPHAQTLNDLPIRLYGVIPILVTDPTTKLEPVLTMPDILRPESKTVIKVREKTGKPMTYTIAVVDEGILDLTRFKTPDPWNSFYAREALGVKTWDLYDQVLGAYGGKLEQIFAIGGDESNRGKSPKKVNRFKPMVIYLGPFELKSGASASHTINIPQYIGSVRTMIVAGQNGAYGNAEKATPVRKPLMVLATLPRVLGPGETVKLPITVFAMENQVKDVKIQISTNNMLGIEGTATKQIRFSKTGDQVVTFDLRVPKRLGVGKVKVLASSGIEKAETSIELEVRSPNPVVTNYVEKAIDANKSWKSDLQYAGMEGTNKLSLEVSNFLPVDFSRRLAYLIHYPYGCVEQTTSSGFPQLYLDEVTVVTSESKSLIQKNVNATIQRLKNFQNASGGFSYWPDGQAADDWSTSYAGHFLIEAERKGYVLPSGIKDNWVKYQVNAARIWSPENHSQKYYYSWRDLAQAYRLYTLALAKSPQLPAMNRMREMKDLSSEVKARLAAAYALAGQQEVARELLANYKTSQNTTSEMYETYGSDDRDNALLLETMCVLGDKGKAFILAREIGEELRKENWMSTQTTAYSLIGIAKYLKLSGGTSKSFSFSYSVNGSPMRKVVAGKSIWQLEIPIKGGVKGNVVVQNEGNAMIFARVVMSGQPDEGDKRTFENNLKLKVEYKDMKGKPLDPSKLEQGTDFMAEVSINNAGFSGNYRNLALTQIFPSGWEIINYRLNDVQSANMGDKPDYEDIRDDRVYTFFSLHNFGSRRFTVMLNATYLGRYYLSGPYCESMYDDRITARKAGKWVEVVSNVKK
jgi:uncharacterized protein YfaS (alpha-2-macroglobulin family)